MDMILAGILLLLLLFSAEVEPLSLFACEGDRLQIMCPVSPYTVLLIRSAMYGRHQGHINRCGEYLPLRKKCDVDVTQYLKYQCEGQATCDIMVDIATFNAEFCPDVLKYAEVVYECVPTTTVDELRRCSDSCLPGASAANSLASRYTSPTGAAAALGMTSNSIVQPKLSMGVAPSAPLTSASSLSLSTSTAQKPALPSAPASSHSPIPSLPYGNLNRSFAAALNIASPNIASSQRTAPSGTGNAKSALSTAQSAAAKGRLLARIRRLMEVLRGTRQG